MLDFIDWEELSDPFFYIPLIIIVGGLVYYFFFSEKPQVQAPKRIVSVDLHTHKPTKKPKAAGGTGHSLKIFYGSQTGTAEDFSHKLASEARLYGFDPEVIDLEEYDPDDLKSESMVIFCVATYGEGEPTDNARQFSEWLCSEERSNDSLKGLRYTVFGLGNKTYEHYNFIGKQFDKRLEQLGAERVFKKGEGDDDGSLEDDFSAWKKELWPAMCTLFNITVDKSLFDNSNTRRFKIEWHEKSKQPSHRHLHSKKAAAISYDIKNPYMAKILVNNELHSKDSDRSCRHIEIEVSSAVRYETGDHVGIYPENDVALVTKVAQRLEVDLDAVFSMLPIENKGSTRPFLGPCSVRQCLMQWTDLSGSPRKSFLSILANYAQDPNEKQFLQKLSDDADPQLYSSFVKDHMRSIYEVLMEFKSVKLPFDHFVEAAPRLAPRYYSISSCPKVHPNKIHVTCVVVNFKTQTGRIHDGVASSWFSRQIPNGLPQPEVPVFIEKASFRLPKDPNHAVIMIGPGTGLAPFRGFIQDRKWLLQTKAIKTENILFFGCRARNIDYIYRDELVEAEKEGVLTKLIVAFSREDGSKKVYVQDKMLEHSAELWRLLNEKNGHFYVCGDAKNMAKDVRKALLTIIMKEGNKTEQEAEQFVQKMQDTSRYQTDVWF